MAYYILIVLGALLLIAAVPLTVTKKLPLQWGLSLLACALVLGVVGGVGAHSRGEKEKEDYGFLYMALSYLEVRETDRAALYIKQVDLENNYHLMTAQALLDLVRENYTMADVWIGMVSGMKLSEEEEDGLSRLEKWDPADAEDLERAADDLLELLPLSEDDADYWEDRFKLERGEGDEDDLDDLPDEERLRIEIDRAVAVSDWEEALDQAAELVHEKPSAENRLLLASIVAELTYYNSEIKTSDFTKHTDSSGDNTQREEAREYENRYEDLLDELEDLEEEIEDAEGEELAELLTKQAELTEEADQLKTRADHVFAFRALNSIADIYSLEAEVVRAKLYYSMQNYQKAMETLSGAAGSVQALLSADQSLVSSLEMVRGVWEGAGSVGVDSPEFRDEMVALFGSVHPDMVSLNLGGLSNDMADYIVEDQRTYGEQLFVLSLDDSDYPNITVQLGGQEKVIDRITNKEAVILTDTRTVLTTYEIEEQTVEQGMSSICFVVDVSGSMDGYPIVDAKEALMQFLSNVDGYTELSLVSFESYANTVVELTTNPVDVRAGVESLYASGGTEITSGIKEGTAALANALGSPTMILMTDGQSSVSMDVVAEAAAQGITIYTIGFGDVNDGLLQEIANATGGQYFRAEDSSQLASVYNSLSRMVGQTVTVTYTVTGEETERYFYIRDDASGASVRQPYYPGAAAAEDSGRAEPVTVTSVPQICTRESLDDMSGRGQTVFSVTLNGTGMDDVALAVIDGVNCSLTSQSGTYVSLEAPTSLSNGVHDITLRTQDGQDILIPGVLWVGDRVDCWSYTAGGLRLNASAAVFIDGKGLVLSGISIREAKDEENTVSMYLNGVLAFPVSGTDKWKEDDGGYPSTIHLGDSGTAAGRGVLTIDSGDGAYDYSVSNYILEGEMTLTYGDSSSTFQPGEVSGT